MNSLKPVRKLLADGGEELRRLLARAESLQRASQVLRAHLDAPLAQHCQVANIKDGSVVIHADSPAWAAKLRFHVAGMLEKFNKSHSFGTVRAIRIKVSPLSEARPSARAERLVLSQQAAAVLKSAADAVVDPELKKVLLKLSQRQIPATSYISKE
ncbi:MAG: DUF721 domain-containing protein [Gammaproteobacteria bacterium]